jgi:hypothetical protein
MEDALHPFVATIFYKTPVNVGFLQKCQFLFTLTVSLWCDSLTRMEAIRLADSPLMTRSFFRVCFLQSGIGGLTW